MNYGSSGSRVGEFVREITVTGPIDRRKMSSGVRTNRLRLCEARKQSSGSDIKRTFDRRGARAIGLAARPPARFISLPST